MSLPFQTKPTSPRSCAGGCRRLLMPAGITVRNNTAWASKRYSWTQKHVQTSKAPLKTQHQGIHLGSRFCWLCVWQMLLCPSRVPSDSGAEWGLFVKEKRKRGEKKHLWYTSVVKVALCIISGCDTVRSQVKQSQAWLSNCTGESPRRKKKKVRHWNKWCGWLSTR